MRDPRAGRRILAEDGSVVTKCFRREAQSVPEARQFARAVVEDWELQALADTAEVVTSELVTNAVLHASAFRLTLRRLGEDQVQVAVIDRSPVLPQLVEPEAGECHGRGLAIVEALSLKWGVEPMWWGTKKGKKVWADLVTPQAAAPRPDVPERASQPAQVAYVLVVLMVAVLIVGAIVQQ